MAWMRKVGFLTGSILLLVLSFLLAFFIFPSSAFSQNSDSAGGAMLSDSTRSYFCYPEFTAGFRNTSDSLERVISRTANSGHIEFWKLDAEDVLVPEGRNVGFTYAFKAPKLGMFEQGIAGFCTAFEHESRNSLNCYQNYYDTAEELFSSGWLNFPPLLRVESTTSATTFIYHNVMTRIDMVPFNRRGDTALMYGFCHIVE